MLGQLVMYHPLFVPILFLVLGFILAIRGKKLIPFALVLAAIVIGFQYGGIACLFISKNPTFLRFAPFILSALLAWLFIFLYKISFFIAGVFLGYLISTSLFPQMSVIFSIGVSLVLGVLLFTSRKIVFTLLTACIGGILFANGLVNLLAWANFSAGVLFYWISFVLTFLFGFFSQMRERK